MSTAIWGEQESPADEAYPLPLLKQLLLHAMGQFAASGGCVALYNERLRLMEVALHLRLPHPNPDHESEQHRRSTDSLHQIAPRLTISLANDPGASALGRLRRPPPLTSREVVEEVTAQQNALFPVGSTYAPEDDLIGAVWRAKDISVLSREEYIARYDQGHHPLDGDPTTFLAFPIMEPPLADDRLLRHKRPDVLGVVVLYQTAPETGFASRQRADALACAERMALYLQNAQLRRQQQRSTEYLQQLQEISAAFPSTVQIAKLVEQVYQFVTNVVDVSSMLITFYDRDTKRIYDVFAIDHGKHIKGLVEQPHISDSQHRPLWWKIAQDKKCTLLLEPRALEGDEYDELLTGPWGDQRQAGSFVLLPMKMFNRVTGSLCLTSSQPNVYQPEIIQVLETMLQIITVSIENAKLYNRDRDLLREAKEREELLAAMISALQSISAVLNLTELLRKFVESVTRLVQAEMSIFFLLSPDGQTLIAQAAYAPTTPRYDIDTPITEPHDGHLHDELLANVRIPFKGSLRERITNESFFDLDQQMAEELANECEEGGAIFLRETHIRHMLMIPVFYQSELLGILGVHAPKQQRLFRPTEVGMLLALCGQAAGAIRDAQLFEELHEKNTSLQRMNMLKDEFLVTASHELRTPLTAITGYSSLLKRQSGRIAPPQILRLAGKISSAAQQLSDLLANMTEASKLGTVNSKLDLQVGSVQLQAVVDMAVSLSGINIEQEIEVHVASDLWVSGDPLRVRQVITNLMENAAKYSPPASRIKIAAFPATLSEIAVPHDQLDEEIASSTPVVVVEVLDEGEGISQQDQQRIFEKFVRAPRSLTTPVRGSGLGLFICRRWINAMGGRLWLRHSVPGEGSAFRFYLKAIETPAEFAEQQNPQDSQGQDES
jgi:K+-sensing histidine kinase KdpD